MSVGKRPFLYASTHSLPLLALAVDDPLIGALVVARLEAARRLAPRGHRMASARSAAFATAVRVIDRIHRDAAVVWPLAQPAGTSGFAEALVLVIRIPHLPDRCHALDL